MNRRLKWLHFQNRERVEGVAGRVKSAMNLAGEFSLLRSGRPGDSSDINTGSDRE